jgi:hypothetical protein
LNTCSLFGSVGNYCKRNHIRHINPEIVISIICTPVQIVQESGIQEVKIPITCCAVYRIQQIYKAKPSKKNPELIFKAISQLAVQSSIQLYKNLGLRQALQIEKRKRQQGKCLNLIGKEDCGIQIFTLSQVELMARPVPVSCIFCMCVVFLSS